MPNKPSVGPVTETARSTETAPLPIPQSATKVVQAERMVDEILHSMSALALSKGCRVNYITISKIAKGDSQRISEKVYFAIKSFYEAFKAGTLNMPPSRPNRGPLWKPESSAAPAAASGIVFPSSDEDGSVLERENLISVAAIQAEVSRLEHRLEVLRQMLALARQL